MEAESFTNLEIIKFMNRQFIPVRVDVDRERKTASEYFVRGLPTSWFLESDGSKITNIPGYVNPETFLVLLNYIASDSYKKVSLKEYLEKKVE